MLQHKDLNKTYEHKHDEHVGMLQTYLHTT